MTLRILLILTFMWTMMFIAGCTSAPRNVTAIDAYYRYDFTTAREALRGDAMLRTDEQTILNNAALGVSALADGDLNEAELTLGATFDLLSTAGLNEDRTTAAVLMHEGVRIWKGEPFEQALMYHYVSTLYAVMDDWENARAAAANSLFRLTDFGRYNTPEQLTRRAAGDPDFLEAGYTAVDTNFALGFLMQAIGSDLSGAAGRDELLDAALAIDPSLEVIVERLRSGAYDTLLVIHYGKGPAKVAYGPNNALSRFIERDFTRGPLVVRDDGEILAALDPVADVNRMARDHRWNNLEDIRMAKSAIGDVLFTGGAIATTIGVHERSAEAALAGLGAMVLGALTKSGAKADTRHLEMLPQAVFLVPLRLEYAADLQISVTGDAGSTVILPHVEPGTLDQPRTIYLRMHGPHSRRPAWLTATALRYGNDHTGVMPGDYPWILGGRDVSTPNRETLEAYQRHGYLQNFTVEDLRDLYRAEDILIGSGAEDRPDRLRNPSFRHILEGGTGLFTPHPDSLGYKRLMYNTHPPYEPKSDLVRNAAEQIRVKKEDTKSHSP